MPSRTPSRLTFTTTDPRPLVEVVARLLSSTEGWVNVAPDLGDGQPPVRETGWLASRGPAAPFITFVAPRARRGGRRDRAQLGVEHASGPKVVARLAEAGVGVPAGWLVRQDHPKRGLVLGIPPDVAADVVVGWLLAAAGLLSQVPLNGTWLADSWE